MSFITNRDFILKADKKTHGLSFTATSAVSQGSNCGLLLYDIRYPLVMLKIVNIYITPIVEYCSIIWAQKRITIEKRIEKVWHIASRMALGTPYRQDDVNYINFETRMRTLGQLTFLKRRIISSIIYLGKILKGESKTKLAQQVIRCRNTDQVTRSPNPFIPLTNIHFDKVP